MQAPTPPGRYTWIMVSVWLAAGVAAQVALWFEPNDAALWDRILLALSIGVLSGLALYRFTITLHQQRFWKQTKHLPRSIHMEQQDDGSIVCFVETFAGEPRILTLPEGYDPREDSGRRLFELLAEPESKSPSR